MHSTGTSHRNPHTLHAVDNADWLKTVAIISVSVGHINTVVMGNVVQAGNKLNPAREAAINGGAPVDVRFSR